MSASDLPDLLSPEFARDPYPIYHRMLEEAPLLWHEGLQSYLVSRYEDVYGILKNAVFSTKPYDDWAAAMHGRSIPNMDGREHSTHRQLVGSAFRGKELENFSTVIAAGAKGLIEEFHTEGRVDLVGQFATRYPINVILDWLDLPKADFELFHRWYSSIMAFFYNLAGDPAVIEQGMKTKEELAAYVIPLVQQRRNSPGSDLLSKLATAEIDGVMMTDEEVKAFVSLLLVAGGETTDKAFSSMWRYLVSNPEQLKAVQDHRTLIDRAFLETLRMAVPVQVVPRTATEDVELSTGVVPAGKNVLTLLGAAHRDPRRWSEPDRFNLFRDDIDTSRGFTAAADHVGFGAGRHFCVGAMLAKAEVDIAANQLLDTMKDVRFAEGFEPAEEGVFARGPKRLLLEFTPA